MGKRIREVLALVLSFIMVICTLPGMDLTAKAADAISYLNDDNQDSTVSDYTVISADTKEWGNGGWYVVKSKVEIEDRITVSGTANLILCDGETLTAKKGIKVSNGNTLKIYGQAAGSGTLIATGEKETAGIGGGKYEDGKYEDGGNIIISGGIVTATGGACADGIGGGKGSACETITISGGTINANVDDTVGNESEEGSALRSTGDIIIDGGNVTATTTDKNGYALYSAGNITINGGTIEAHTSGDNGNAIYCDNITVNGGSIRSVTEGNGASGIKADSITINDGVVYAEAKGSETDDNNYGIMSGGRIIINGGQVTAKGTKAGIYSSERGEAVYLSWKNETDFVSANSFRFQWEEGNVAIEPGKTFKTSVNGQDHYYVAANASEVKGLKDFTLSATSDMVYAVSFDCGEYGTVPPVQLLKANSENCKVSKPDDLVEGTSTYDGKIFAGWYQDDNYQIRYDFNSEVTSDLYLYAKWATESNSLENASVKMIYRYTGETVEPVVENNVGKTLRKDTDYEISSLTYEETGAAVDNLKDPGFYRLTITGKGTYTGKQENLRVCVLTFDAYDPASGTLSHNVTLPEGKDAAIVTSSTVSMNTGWYVVTEDVKMDSRIKVKGDVHLVLCDGVTLDAAGMLENGDYQENMGISVTEGNSLTIYSQEGNSGKLDASTRKVNYYAAIGGDCPANYSNNSNNNINNNNGNFSFLNGKENGNAGSITIHGGEIIAKGSMYSAAIGKAGKDGVDGKGGKITIYGGKITAERFTSYGDINSQSDTAIGGPGAEIHLSHCREDDYILSEGYQGTLNFDRAFIIEDTSTLVKPENINDSLGKKILPVDSFDVCTVTFDSNGGTPVKAQTLARGKLATMPATPIKRGYKFVGWYTDRKFDEQFRFDLTYKPVDTDLILFAKWVEVDPINYIGAGGQISGFKAYSLMQEDYTELPAGSYYVDQTITLPDRVKVTGEVNLILGDGYTLTVPRGISVMGDNTLNIFCQSGGTGRLIAEAASKNAAIGGDSSGDNVSGASGNINIYGGNIEVKGSESAAAIGGGKNNQNYGTIRIYGGSINAISGKYAAAIGGGMINSSKNAEKVTDGTIEIYGGKITVNKIPENTSNTGNTGNTGNTDNNGNNGNNGNNENNNFYENTGIGGGKNSYGGNISILGGQVTVYVKPNRVELPPYSGIGDGYLYEGAEKAQITLGCGNADDFIYAEQYYGNVRVAPYQTLQIAADDDSTKFYGEISEPNNKIKNKKLKLSHTHELTFSVNGSTITASCSDPGCTLHDNPAVLTLHAPSEQDIVYDSNEWPAIVTDEHGISGYASVYYEKKEGNSFSEKGTAAPEAVGTYRASIKLADERSHSTATVSVEYTIIKREVTISGLTVSDKIYDDTTTASVDETAMVLNNMIEGDAVSIVSGNAAFADADAGNNKTVTFTGYSLTGEAAGNYNLLSQPASVTADIEKRPVTIKADDQTVQFGHAIEEMAVSYEQGTDKGILSGKGHEIKAITLTPAPDPRSVVSIPPIYPDPGAAPSPGTITGSITPSGAVIKRGKADVTGNYDITYQNGSLEITWRKAKVTKSPTAGVNLKYQGFEKKQWLLSFPGEADTKMEYKVQQISRGDGELLKNPDDSLVRENEPPTDGYNDAFDAWEAGTYHVWYRAAMLADDVMPSEPGCITVEIAAAPLTVKAPDASITYGDAFPSLTPVVNGFVTPEEHAHIGTVKLEYQSGDEWKDAKEAATQGTCLEPGTYPLRVSYNGNGEVNSCYDVTYVPGTLTVEPRIVTLSWGNAQFTYDGNPHVPAVTLSNLAQNEDSDAVTAVVLGEQVNVGQDYIATAVKLSGTKANYYKLPSENSITFSITKKDAGNIPDVELSVPVSASSFTSSLVGLMPADAGALTYSLGTITFDGSLIAEGDFSAEVDNNGLLTVNVNKSENDLTNKTVEVNVDVGSTNYITKTITVKATFIEKSDAGVSITADNSVTLSGNSISVNINQVNSFTLQATVDNYGTGETLTWESSNANVATVTGNSNGSSNVNITGIGTSSISVKYDSNSSTGYVTLLLTVEPTLVTIPTAKEGLTYTGEHIMAIGNYDNTIIGVSGASESHPGNYVATVSLLDTVKYRWEDGTKDTKYIPWSIDKAAGPAAPTGLTGIAPTTGDNIDGKISGVKNTMEYSTNENFTGAIRCTNGDIIGLTPGKYYVRVRETDTAKAGAAVKVEVKACPVPVVKARQGLVYDGSSQVLAESDEASKGKLYYAVVKKGDPEPAGKEYTLSSPTAKDAGSYYVWYKTSGNADASYVEAAIRKKEATVKLSAADKLYDGSTVAKLTITVDGVCAGDSIVITGVSGKFVDKNFGGAKNVLIDSSGKIIIGAENYELSQIPGSTQAAIQRRDLSINDGAVVIQEIPVQYYTGSEVRPKPVVKCLGMTLEENEDYTLSYDKNTNMSTDMVKATVTVTGINNCDKSITREFEIGLPAFGTVTVAAPGNKNFGTALGAAPAVTAKDAAGQDIDLKNETVTVYYSSSSTGKGEVWDSSIANLNAGTYYVWAEVSEKTGDGGHAAAKSALVSFKVNKVPYDKPDQNILPVQEAGYDVTVTLPNGEKNTDYEYAITADSLSKPAADSDVWSVLPVLKNGKFTVTGLNAGENYKIWLRRKADSNHTASDAIYKLFSTPATVMLSYDLNGGSGTVSTAKSYDVGSMTDTIDPGLNISRYGYTFSTWNMQADGAGENVAPGETDFIINSTMVLYAQWIPNTYTVNYDPNGGTGTMASQMFAYDTAKDLRWNTFTRSGYIFAGWATKADGAMLYKDHQNVKNLVGKGTITLYAVWVEESWSVSGIVKEGENEQNSTPVYGVEIIFKHDNIMFGTAQETDILGQYSFTGVPAGIYNVVATRTLNGKEQTVTTLVEVTSGNVEVSAIMLPSGNVNSEIEIKNNTPAVMVGGLDDVAEENAEEGKEVTVKMTVESKSDDQAEGSDELRQLAEANTQGNTEVEIDYLDISIEKKTEGLNEAEAITETANVIELIIPFSFTGRKNFQVLSFHEGEAREFKKLKTRPGAPVDGTFVEDPENSRIFMYSNLFSTFAISYESKVGYSVTFLKNDGSSEQYTQEIAADTSMPVAFTQNTFSRDGYYFDGWNTDANGKEISYSNGEEVTFTFDLVLYAQWKVKTYPEFTKRPEAIGNLVYNGNALTLITSGTVKDGLKLVYALGSDKNTAPVSANAWKETLPSATNVDTYYVWYKALGDRTHTDSNAYCIPVIINKKLSGIETAPEAVTSLKYTGKAQKLIIEGTAKSGAEIYYALGKDSKTVPAADEAGSTEKRWFTVSPEGTKAGTYYVWYKVAVDKNHKFEDENAGCLTVTISRKSVTVTADNKTKDSGTTDEQLTATVSGLAEGDTPDLIAYSLNREVGETAGTYAITVTGAAEQNNYTVSFVPGTYTINARKDTDSGNVSTPEHIVNEETGKNTDSGNVSTPEHIVNEETEKTVVTETDDYKLTVTTIINADESVTEKSVKEFKNGNTTTKITLTDKNGKTILNASEAVSFSKKGTKTVTTNLTDNNGYNFRNRVTTTKAGKETVISETRNPDKSSSYVKMVTTPKGKVTRNVIETNAEGKTVITIGTYTVDPSNISTKNTGTFELHTDSLPEDASTLSELIYEVTSAGKAKLIRCNTVLEEITVPSKIRINGKTYSFNAISKGAFKGCDTLKKVKLGKSITTIGAKAFANLENLEEITFLSTSKDGVKVNKNAFTGISSEAKFYSKASAEARKKILKRIKKSGYKTITEVSRVK